MKTLCLVLMAILLTTSLAFAECRATLCNAANGHTLSLQIDNGPISAPVKLGELTTPVTVSNEKHVFKAIENGKVVAQETFDLREYDAYIWTINR
jgi:hypothetical protein